jgi:hypothetical protein
MKLKFLTVKRAHGVSADRQGSRFLTDDELAELAECEGELRVAGNHWAMDYGEHKKWFSVVAQVDPEPTEPAFENPIHPVDTCGVPVQPGKYIVTKAGEKKSAAVVVFENVDTAELWIRKAAAKRTDRPTKLAEMSRDCVWEPVASQQTTKQTAAAVAR